MCSAEQTNETYKHALPITAAPAKHWDNIPQELQELHQWAIANHDKAPKDGNLTNISASDFSKWMSFQQACEAANKHNCNIGFILTEADPYTCIDLDIKDIHTKKDSNDWTTQEELKQFGSLVEFANSYAELSASGRGTHIWIRYNFGTGRRRGCKEVYSQDRFIICTGNAIKSIQYGYQKKDNLPIHESQIEFIPEYGYKPIVDGRAVCEILENELKPGHTATEPQPDSPQTKSDKEILNKAINAQNGAKFTAHFHGNWPVIGHNDHSKADMALLQMLAFYTQNNEQLTRLFLLSKLGERGKATRPDYLPRTIEKVRQLQSAETHKANQNHVDFSNMLVKGKTVAEWSESFKKRDGNYENHGNKLNAIHLDEFEQQDQEIDFVIEDVLERGAVYCMTGNTGAGKTAIAVTTTLSIAAGISWGTHDVAKGDVLYIAGENPSDVRRRFITMRGTYKNELSLVDKNIHIIHQSFILNDDMLPELIDICNNVMPVLIMIDTDQAVSGAIDENSNAERLEQAKRYRLLSKCNSRPTVVIQTHPTKQMTKDTLQPRGASSLRNEVDGNICCWRDSKKNPDLTELFSDADKWRGMQFKLNFRKHMGHVITKKKDGSTVPIPMLIPDSTDITAPNIDKEQTEVLLRLIYREYEKEIFTHPAANSPDVAYKVLYKDPEFPKNLTSQKTQYLLKRAHENGLIEIEEYTHKEQRKARKRWRVIKA